MLGAGEATGYDSYPQPFLRIHLPLLSSLTHLKPDFPLMILLFFGLCLKFPYIPELDSGAP